MFFWASTLCRKMLGLQQLEGKKELLPSKASQERLLDELGFRHRPGWEPCTRRLLCGAWGRWTDLSELQFLPQGAVLRAQGADVCEAFSRAGSGKVSEAPVGGLCLAGGVTHVPGRTSLRPVWLSGPLFALAPAQRDESKVHPSFRDQISSSEGPHPIKNSTSFPARL